MTARPLMILAVFTSALSAAACASAPTDGSTRLTYGQELDKLTDDCRARGGILAPLANGGMSGRPQTDYTCNITGGPSRLTRG